MDDKETLIKDVAGVLDGFNEDTDSLLFLAIKKTQDGKRVLTADRIGDRLADLSTSLAMIMLKDKAWEKVVIMALERYTDIEFRADVGRVWHKRTEAKN